VTVGVPSIFEGPAGTWRLEVDVDGATYRRDEDGKQGKICDFLTIWQSGGSPLFGVAEMKSGAAREDALRQLQAGLDLIDRLDVDGVLRPRRAWLVCKGQTQQPRKLLLTKGGKALPFRGAAGVVPVVVVRCGERIILEG
jgi:hypothetical protein